MYFQPQAPYGNGMPQAPYGNGMPQAPYGNGMPQPPYGMPPMQPMQPMMPNVGGHPLASGFVGAPMGPYLEQGLLQAGDDHHCFRQGAVGQPDLHKAGQGAVTDVEGGNAIGEDQVKHELIAKQEEERLRLEVEMKRDAEAFEAKIKQGEILNPKSTSFVLPEPKLGAWFPDNELFWQQEGRLIAWRNLFVSMFNLLLGFAIWLMWSIFIVRIQKVHDDNPEVYAFKELGALTDDEYTMYLTSIPAIAGLAGGTFRLSNSFMVMPIGGRLVITCTTVLLTIPCLIAYSALRRTDCTYASLVVAAMFSGVGGGAFASSMSNISFFFPKSQQGLALGLNAGIGNLGVSLSQVFCPLVMKYAAFGATVLIGGQRVYNGALWWFPYCCVFIVLAWAWLSDMPQHGNKPLATRFFYYVCMQGQAYVASGAAVGIFFATLGKDAFSSPGGKVGRIFMLVFIAAVLMHLFMWFGSPAQVKQKLVIQADIFKNKHTFIMTWLYIMSFGSFIGYSGAFPALIKYLFGYIRDPITGERVQIPDPKYKATTYAFLGPLIGSLIRPVGGWLSDKFGGALVTQVDLAVMIGATFGVGAVIQQTYNDDQDPEKHFPAFFGLFLLLFATTGIANGSTFKQISMLFLNIGKPEQAGPVLGWSSAIASYGAMIIPGVIGIAITQRNVPANFYGFAGYYITCFVLNAYCYLRPGTPDKC